MSKSKKYSSFRDFYEEDGRKGKPKLNESKKTKDKFRTHVKNMNPKDMDEDEFDEFDEYDLK